MRRTKVTGRRDLELKSECAMQDLKRFVASNLVVKIYQGVLSSKLILTNLCMRGFVCPALKSIKQNSADSASLFPPAAELSNTGISSLSLLVFLPHSIDSVDNLDSPEEKKNP